MAYPLEQGLKRADVSLKHLGRSVLMAYPLEQGLKLHLHSPLCSECSSVLMAYPLEQGLKQIQLLPVCACGGCLNGLSTRTRIETPLVSAKVPALVLS